MRLHFHNILMLTLYVFPIQRYPTNSINQKTSIIKYVIDKHTIWNLINQPSILRVLKRKSTIVVGKYELAKLSS